MKNPIKNIGMFHTPKGWRELKAWIEGTGKATGAGPYILTAAMMAWNLAGAIVDDEIKTKEEA